MKYTTVSDLELKGNSIGGPGLATLANVIRNNFNIRTINLAWNNLGQNEGGLSTFFNALGENKALQKIDLSNNEIGPDVCEDISSALKSNSQLQTLDLRWNRIGNVGAKVIVKGLQLNKSIQILDLAGNKVSDDYLRQINEILNRNKSGGQGLATSGKFFDNSRGRDLPASSIIHDQIIRDERPFSPVKGNLFERPLDDFAVI